eukprot:scpid110435/ scgid10118/ 
MVIEQQKEEENDDSAEQQQQQQHTNIHVHVEVYAISTVGWLGNDTHFPTFFGRWKPYHSCQFILRIHSIILFCHSIFCNHIFIPGPPGCISCRIFKVTSCSPSSSIQCTCACTC